MKRFFRKLSISTKTTSIFSAILGLAGLYVMFSVVVNRYATFDISKTEDQVLVIGFLAVLLVLLRSLGQAIYGICWPEKRIVSDLGVAGSRYSFESILDSRASEIFIIGQNLRTLMSTTGFKEKVEELIRNPNGPYIWFIGSTWDGMKAISSECAQHFLDTLGDFRDLYESSGDQVDRLRVRFHPSAISLSCIIRDPDDNKRGIAVMTPKWARDADPANRHYCVIERWEHRDIFNRVSGHRVAMTQADSLRLKDMSKIIKKDIANVSFGISEKQALDLDYFDDRNLP